MPRLIQKNMHMCVLGCGGGESPNEKRQSFTNIWGEGKIPLEIPLITHLFSF